MSQAPIISIIIPVYKVEKYLRRCLDSVINQTLKNIEIIVIDDASADTCGQIIDEYAKKDTRIIPIHKKKNEGLGAAYNTGIKRARGRYIGFVESDDWIEKNMFETLYMAIKDTDLDIVKSNFYIHLPGNTLVKYRYEDLFHKDYHFPKRFTFAECKPLATGVLGFWSGLYRADFIKKNHLTFIGSLTGAAYADVFFFWVAMIAAKSISCIDEYLYHYDQQRVDTSVKAVDKKAFNIFDQFRYVEEYLAEKRKTDQYLDILKKVEIHVYSIFYNQILSQYRNEFIDMARKRLANVDEKLLQSDIFNEADKHNLRLLLGQINQIPIVLSCNEKYAQHLATTIASLLYNSKKNDLILYVLNNDISLKTKKKIDELKNIRQFQIHYIHVNDAHLKKIAPFPPFFHLFSIEAYYRLLLPNLLPHVGRCIYMDVDCIVVEDIQGLWLQDTGDKPIAALRDINFTTVDAARKKLGLGKNLYFNSGVMILDLNYMRTHNYAQTFLKFIKLHHEKITYVDQCVLNYYLYNKVHYLPLRWNCGFVLFESGRDGQDIQWKNLNPYPKEEVAAATQNPAIIHYFGVVKPWHHTFPAKKHPFYKEYIKYAKMTPWKNTVIKDIVISDIKLIYESSVFHKIRYRVAKIQGTIYGKVISDTISLLYNLIVLLLLLVIYPVSLVKRLIKYAKYF